MIDALVYACALAGVLLQPLLAAYQVAGARVTYRWLDLAVGAAVALLIVAYFEIRGSAAGKQSVEAIKRRCYAALISGLLAPQVVPRIIAMIGNLVSGGTL